MSVQDYLHLGSDRLLKRGGGGGGKIFLIASCFSPQVLRPFLLRRLKDDVEKQMPKKYEHIVMCHLAKRQRFLYDEFMAQGK